MPQPPPVTSRRTAVVTTWAGLAGLTGLTGLAAAGCTGDSGGPSGDDTPISPTDPGTTAGTAAPPSGGGTDPDLAALQEARTVVGTRLDLVRRTSGRHRRLAATLAPLVGVHRAHDRLLAGATSRPRPPRTPVPVPGERGRALELLHAQEATLQRRLAELAQDASSGAVARLLASMAAAVAQQAAVLPSPRGARPVNAR